MPYHEKWHTDGVYHCPKCGKYWYQCPGKLICMNPNRIIDRMGGGDPRNDPPYKYIRCPDIYICGDEPEELCYECTEEDNEL